MQVYSREAWRELELFGCFSSSAADPSFHPITKGIWTNQDIFHLVLTISLVYTDGQVSTKQWGNLAPLETIQYVNLTTEYS